MAKLRALSVALGVSIDWLVHGPRRYDMATDEELDANGQPVKTKRGGRGRVTREEQRDEAGKRAKQRTRPSPRTDEGGPHPG